MLSLTDHFIENWRQRVGGEPSISHIAEIIRQSVRVQKADLLAANNPKHHTLTIYWHPDRKLIIKVDPFTRNAVTVMSRKNMPPVGG